MDVLREKVVGLFDAFESGEAVDLETWRMEIESGLDVAVRGFAELGELRNLNTALDDENRLLRKVLTDEHRAKLSLLGEVDTAGIAAQLMDLDARELVEKRVELLDRFDRVFRVVAIEGGTSKTSLPGTVFRDCGAFSV